MRWLIGVYHRRSFALAGALALTAAVFSAGGAAGQAKELAQESGKPHKPAWQWSLAERLAARFDVANMDARMAEDAAKREKWLQTFDGEIDIPETQPSIDGRRAPELLLPHELFSALISEAFPEDGRPSEMRGPIEEGAAVLGFGSDLWTRLEKSAAPYLKLRSARYRSAMAALARSQSLAEDETVMRLECRARADALAKAQAEFGKDSFMRLLYEVVAPMYGIDYTGVSNEADRLRSQEGGCRWRRAGRRPRSVVRTPLCLGRHES